MYARRVGNRTLTFAVSGMLWHRSLVMIDLETKSLWSQLLGQAQRGPLRGANLELLPARMTDWKTWRRLHPETTVVMLPRTSADYRREFYRNPAQFVVGVAGGGNARAWSFDQLLKTPVVNDRFDGTPLLVVFDPASNTALLYQRHLGQRELSLMWRGGKVVDRLTQSTWDLRTGRALTGPLKGRQLRPVPGVVSYRHSWKIFHPNTTFYRTTSTPATRPARSAR